MKLEEKYLPFQWGGRIKEQWDRLLIVEVLEGLMSELVYIFLTTAPHRLAFESK